MNTDFERGTGRLAVSPAEAAQMLGLGRTKFYELMGANEIASMKIGTRRLIRVAVLEAWLKAQEAGEDAAP
jgi:excisionase family DNA binding protein